MYGIIDFSRIDTNPGSASAFAPPKGWVGDYLHYMRDRWKIDPGVRQHVSRVGRMLKSGEAVEFRGAFAVEAKQIAELVVSH